MSVTSGAMFVPASVIEARVKELRDAVKAHGCELDDTSCERCWGRVCAADELERLL